MPLAPFLFNVTVLILFLRMFFSLYIITNNSYRSLFIIYLMTLFNHIFIQSYRVNFILGLYFFIVNNHE